MDQDTIHKTCCAKYIGLFIALSLISLFIFLSFLSYFFYKKTQVIGRPENVRDTISVTGHGETSAIPDVAILQAGLETTAKTVGVAQKENTQKMNDFLQKVKSFGVSEKDRKTLEYSIYPKYEYRRTDNNIDKQVLVGYSITNKVQLKVRNFDKLPEVLQSLGESGLNQVGSFSFQIDDEQKVRQEALEKAIKNANEKAQGLGRAGDIRIGKMISFSESGASIPVAYPERSYYEMKAGASSPAPAPIAEPGTQEMSVDVQVSFELLP